MWQYMLTTASHSMSNLVNCHTHRSAGKRELARMESTKTNPQIAYIKSKHDFPTAAWQHLSVLQKKKKCTIMSFSRQRFKEMNSSNNPNNEEEYYSWWWWLRLNTHESFSYIIPHNNIRKGPPPPFFSPSFLS